MCIRDRFVIIVDQGEISCGVKCFVAQKLECATVESIRSGFGNHIDLATRIVPIFSVKIVGDNTEFSNRIQVWNNRCARESKFLNCRSIQQKSIGRLALPVDRQVPGIQIAGNVVKGESSGTELTSLTSR